MFYAVVSLLYSRSFLTFFRYIVVSMVFFLIFYTGKAFLLYQNIVSFSPSMISNTIVSPSFTTFDDKKRPVFLNAASVVSQTGKRYSILAPSAKMTYEAGHDVFARSKTGFYQQDQKRLFLDGGVHLTSMEGYWVNTAHALLNFALQTAGGTQKVAGASDQASFQSQGFYYEKGVLTLKGPCQMRLNIKE